ncbi:hypothetical protein FYM84_04280 [Pseudomonas sp. CAH-1]|nr:hypothetical protein [Pseudomonas sp. CAH-1]QDR66404.1 hypothetical protein FPB55_01470 [Pseudomonas sp. BJP69]QEQ86150.1 hypothetical protein F1602_01980 [Pseudomonas putida]
MKFGWAHQAVPFYRMGWRQTLCRRFGASICLCPKAPRCKNDRGFAESVNARQQGIWRAGWRCETVSTTAFAATS